MASNIVDADWGALKCACFLNQLIPSKKALNCIAHPCLNNPQGKRTRAISS